MTRKEFISMCSNLLDKEFSVEGVDEISIRIECRCTNGGVGYSRDDYSMSVFDIKKSDYLKTKFKGDFKETVDK